MKLPRNLSGERLSKILIKHGYRPAHSSGSHLRLFHPGPPKHSVTIPMHAVLKVGTLNAILTAVAKHLKTDKNSILRD
ncbi:MAG: type II toxin-antitoxin system HicA family toxin [bacterium]